MRPRKVARWGQAKITGVHRDAAQPSLRERRQSTSKIAGSPPRIYFSRPFSAAAVTASRQTVQINPRSGTADNSSLGFRKWQRAQLASGLKIVPRRGGSPAGVSRSDSFSRISLHISTHSSQIYTEGPAMSLRTWSSLFPQKEQISFGSEAACLSSGRESVGIIQAIT